VAEMIKSAGTFLLLFCVALAFIVGGWMFDAFVKVKLAQWMGIL
jgi:hypothetical protein